MAARRSKRSGVCVAVLLGAACGSSRSPTTTVGNVADSWPAGDTLTLTWVVGRATIPHPKWEGILLQPLTLEVAIGEVVRTFELKPQQGSLFPYNQSVCTSTAYPLAAGEVAKITFYEGGAGGYLVRRPRPETLAIVEWALGDGACPDANGEATVCPTRYTPLTEVRVPADVRLEEAIVEVDAAGARTQLACGD